MALSDKASAQKAVIKARYDALPGTAKAIAIARYNESIDTAKSTLQTKLAALQVKKNLDNIRKANILDFPQAALQLARNKGLIKVKSPFINLGLNAAIPEVGNIIKKFVGSEKKDKAASRGIQNQQERQDKVTKEDDKEELGLQTAISRLDELKLS
jgi:hypothetical protein